jgi:DNA-binding MarR family transcriptional regulator
MTTDKTYNEIVKFSSQEHEALMGVWWVGQMLKKRARRFFSDYLSSEIQFNIMLLLKYADHPLSQQELSEKLLVDKSNLTGVAGRMETAGLLIRKVASNNARAYQLELTPLGRQILEHLEPPYDQKVKQLMEEFSPQELDTLIHFMERMQRAVNRENE